MFDKTDGWEGDLRRFIETDTDGKFWFEDMLRLAVDDTLLMNPNASRILDEVRESVLDEDDVLMSEARTEAYDEGHGDGYSEGYERGYESGYDEGYDEGEKSATAFITSA